MKHLLAPTLRSARRDGGLWPPAALPERRSGVPTFRRKELIPPPHRTVPAIMARAREFVPSPPRGRGLRSWLVRFENV